MTQKGKSSEQNCTFCGNNSKNCGTLAEADNEESSVFICEGCARSCLSIIQEEKQKRLPSRKRLQKMLSARELYEHLEDYVIGQPLAKKKLSVEVSNHFKRLFSNQDMNSDSPIVTQTDLVDVRIEKSNVLLLGPTGSGKTLLARSMAEKLNVPFAIGDATTLTEAGYVGEDVENLLLKLLSAADFDIEAAQKGIIYIDEIDKLRKTGSNVSITRDVSGEGVQQSLLKMIEGTVANVPPQGGRKHPEQQYIEIDTTNILFIVGGAFVGLEDIVRARLNKRRIGFQVESEGTKREQFNDLMKQVNGEDLIEFGLIPELIGRLPVIAPLDEISLDDMVQILKRPKNALLLQERKKLLYSDVNVTFTDDAINEIANKAITMGTGARALRTIVADFMTDIYFNVDSSCKGKSIVIDRDVVLKLKDPFKEAA